MDIKSREKEKTTLLKGGSKNNRI